MAAYFATHRRHAPPVPSSPEQRSSRNWDDSVHFADCSTTYIFPCPSSAPPSPSPSHSSILSEHSDASFSLVSFSEIGSPETSPVVIHQEYRPVQPTARQSGNSTVSCLDSWADIQGLSWDLINSPRLDSVAQNVHTKASHHLYDRPTPHGEVVSISAPAINSATGDTMFHRPLTRSLARSSSLILDEEESQSLTQGPRSLLRRPIPLFPLFSSLLRIDESTLDLLAEPTPSAYILFPIDTCPSAHVWDETEVFTPPHGLQKLFSVIAAEKGHQTFCQGIRSFDDEPPSEINLVPVSGIWVVVTELLSRGCQLLDRLSGNLSRRMTGMNQ